MWHHVLNFWAPLAVRHTSRVCTALLLSLPGHWKTSVCFPFVQGFDLHDYSNYSLTKIMRMAIYKERSCWVRGYTGNRRGSTVVFPCYLASLVCKLKHTPPTIQFNFVGEETSLWEDYDKEVPEWKYLLGLFQYTLSWAIHSQRGKKWKETRWNMTNPRGVFLQSMFISCTVKSLAVLKGKSEVCCLLPVFLQAWLVAHQVPESQRLASQGRQHWLSPL